MTEPEAPKPDPGNSPPEQWTAPLTDEERDEVLRKMNEEHE